MIITHITRQIEDKRKMIGFLAIILIIGFLATSIISYVLSRAATRRSILKNELPLTADNIYSEIQRDLLKPIFISSLMANDTFLRDWVINGEKNTEDISRYLAEITSKYDTISAFFVSEKSGIYYYPKGVLKMISDIEPRDEWYFRLKALETPLEINVDPDMANKDTMTIFINHKVFDFSGNLIGATGVGLTVNVVKNRINTYSTRYNRNIYFFNSKGELLLHTENKQVTSPESYHATDIPGLKDFSMNFEENNPLNLELRQAGDNRLINIRYIPDLKWYLVVEQAEDNTSGLLIKTLLINLFICLIISVVTLRIIRVTIIRYQERLENRNAKLEEKNYKIEEQRSLLKEQNLQLEIMNREKDEFIGITAHDLKSPLNAIVGFADLIQHNDTIDEETRQHASYIVSSSMNMVQRINNLLDVGEAESGYDLLLQPFDFRNSVEKTVQDFKFHAQKKEITIKLLFPEHPVMTLANEKWMSEIIGNLVSNAIKYSPKHKTVELRLFTKDRKAILEVADQGPGVTESDLPKLFKKYSRGSAKPTGGETSTGLGLYIVKKMTQRMGGNTWCESKPGEGCRFYVEFPAA
ncbi:sensor histidine kinase [bacterium]|nr:sensor histidine kinase [bacterium]